MALKSAQETSLRHVRGSENFISNEIVIYTIFFFTIGDFSIRTILYIHKLLHTTLVLSLGRLRRIRPLRDSGAISLISVPHPASRPRIKNSKRPPA